jgi:hypothetical protein
MPVSDERIAMETSYRINKSKVVHRIIGGEAVMLNLDNGYYYSLDEIGTKIWKVIDDGKSIESLIEVLLGEYEVTETQLRRDIRHLIGSLEDAQLIKKT